MKVHWLDDEIAEIACECDDILIVSVEGTKCDCGRTWKVVQEVREVR